MWWLWNGRSLSGTSQVSLHSSPDPTCSTRIARKEDLEAEEERNHEEEKRRRRKERERASD